MTRGGDAARDACSECTFTRTFFKLYGVGDLAFGLFFGYVWLDAVFLEGA